MIFASMDGPDISAALADLPVPQRGDVPTMSKQEAVEVCSITYYIIWSLVCDMFLPGGTRAASKGRRPHCFHQERAVFCGQAFSICRRKGEGGAVFLAPAEYGRA